MFNWHNHLENKKDVRSLEKTDNADTKYSTFTDDPNENNFETKMEKYEKFKKQDCNYINSKNLIFSSIVDANVEYGNGEGRQYFIQNAALLKEKNILQKISEEKICYIEEKGNYHKKYSKRTSNGINFLYDNRNVDPQELEYLDINTSREYTEYIKGKEGDIDAQEIAQLESETPSTESLTAIKDGEIHEDYLHPLGNQEDSDGYEADSWNNGREINNGETYYQIIPEYKDKDVISRSSYFTDSETVDGCRDDEGNIDANMLFSKLQKKPNVEVDKDGNISTVTTYRLVEYIYKDC